MLIPFKEIPETREGFPCTAFRWTFQIEKNFIGFVHQAKIKENWHDSHIRVFSISIMKNWLWGEHHFWYDGPHCLFSIGPIQFQWWNDECKKCNF